MVDCEKGSSISFGNFEMTTFEAAIFWWFFQICLQRLVDLGKFKNGDFQNGSSVSVPYLVLFGFLPILLDFTSFSF
ncbi:unnamed protein product [Rhizophagus irregularis]|nr:unnamed protein product [Rhizophagus irregularis]